MLREEAIKYFKEMKDECNDTIHKVRYVTQEEVLDMAIKALEQEPSGDLISRQAVLNQIFYSTDNSGDVALGSVLRRRIENLPSVKQEPKTGHWVTAEMTQDGCRYTVTYCSECDEDVDYRTDYCPNCGCRMVEPQESEG